MLLSYAKKDGSKVKIRVREVSSAPAVTIGRDSTATVQLDDAKCSRIHTAIRYWDDVFVVRDMKSHNGTYLNDKKLLRPKALYDWDEIRIGRTLFIFRGSKIA